MQTNRCKANGCAKPARYRGTLCQACNSRSWRSRNRARERVKERNRAFTPEQQAVRNARAVVAMQVRRGLTKPLACQECGASALPYIPDPTKRRDVLWLCKPHRTERKRFDEEQRKDIAAKLTRAHKAVQWEQLRARFNREWLTLTDDLRERIENHAARDPLAAGLHPQSPLMRQALIRAFGRHIDSAN